MSFKSILTIFLITLISMSHGQTEEPEFVTEVSTQYVTLSQLRSAAQPTAGLQAI
ncbi:hypothetical protein K7432_001707 [Basidiobolus ranarum]|uniref:Uncharacterized protein n=1 Tax=Basidiobolus ranarum TaxID=34480 RepID=A0ABR2W920_9FUNG